MTRLERLMTVRYLAWDITELIQDEEDAEPHAAMRQLYDWLRGMIQILKDYPEDE